MPRQTSGFLQRVRLHSEDKVEKRKTAKDKHLFLPNMPLKHYRKISLSSQVFVSFEAQSNPMKQIKFDTNLSLQNTNSSPRL